MMSVRLIKLIKVNLKIQNHMHVYKARQSKLKRVRIIMQPI